MLEASDAIMRNVYWLSSRFDMCWMSARHGISVRVREYFAVHPVACRLVPFLVCSDSGRNCRANRNDVLMLLCLVVIPARVFVLGGAQSLVVCENND